MNVNMGMTMSIARRHCGYENDLESNYDDEYEYISMKMSTRMDMGKQPIIHAIHHDHEYCSSPLRQYGDDHTYE